MANLSREQIAEKLWRFIEKEEIPIDSKLFEAMTAMVVSLGVKSDPSGEKLLYYLIRMISIAVEELPFIERKEGKTRCN